jgi:NAD(P)-dependent dehydrogenase (short-subunit alcohol dehydrogenase family)
MGRAAVIAYAREGADVAINYYPDEEPDAPEVIKIIKDAGSNGVALPGDLRDETMPWKNSAVSTFSSAMLAASRLMIQSTSRRRSSTGP